MINYTIGIHPDHRGQESYSEKWTEYLCNRGANVVLLNLLSEDALKQASKCSGIMWRWNHDASTKQSAQRILYTIEMYINIPVFPNYQTAWHYDEKISQDYLLRALNAPIPRSWLFWNFEEAIDWARSAPYPVVFKLSTGASSANVLKVEDEAQAIEIIHRAFQRGIFSMTMNEHKKIYGIPHSLKQAKGTAFRLKEALRYIWYGIYPPLPYKWWKPEYGYAYFQEFLGGNEFDTRVTVIGDRAFAFRRFNRSGDFRASGSGLINYDASLIDQRCINIAFEISKRAGFQSMAYDFLFKNREPVITEISYTFVDWAVHKCPGHWLPDLKWVDCQMWPEEAQVEVFLKQVQSK